MIREIKNRSKELIKGKNIFLFIISIIPILISALLFPIFPISLILVILFSFGVSNVYLKVFKGEDYFFNDISIAFTAKSIQRFLVIGLTAFLRIFLYSLLFIIPGIIKYYQLALVNYIAVEKPSLTRLEVLAESTAIMKGKKFDLFKLQLSFIGWWILVQITFGLAGIYVLPYYNMAIVEFYNRVKPKKIKAR